LGKDDEDRPQVLPWTFGLHHGEKRYAEEIERLHLIRKLMIMEENWPWVSSREKNKSV